ncbi:alginate lyase family protein [Bacteriovorax sp. PP10]|uniref:Alginate lyase family protein n=1 Tax=Bacteriovorax antarcticus TaxID=3088717 RepID=A0ABU5VQL6_9BACT|nr:alginate lyase family protein [Bacteriovorax sp. PP10]MEA9355327.1 alginate lyase family protein [Bacteriovorax sp. PP10]
MLKLYLFILTQLFLSFKVEACPSPSAIVYTLDANSFYNDAHHSLIDPELKKKHDDAVKPLENFIRSIAKMSDKYIQDPVKNLSEGHCANAWILSWAKQNAMLGEMKTNQSYSERKWMLAGIGLVYGKTRAIIKPDENLIIESWLKKLADLTMVHSDQYKGTRNNHYYWEGLAVGVVGAITKDSKYLSWSKQVFSNAMDKIQKDGSLIEEMNRGKRAIHYQAFATAPLVVMSSILDLQSDKLKELVRFTYLAISHPETIEKRLGVKQDALTPSNLGWLLVYLRRNPDAEISNFLKTKSSLYTSKLGGNLNLVNPLENISSTKVTK